MLLVVFEPVLWIQMDQKLVTGSGSRGFGSGIGLKPYEVIIEKLSI
jgi:hypothetical protein